MYTLDAPTEIRPTERSHEFDDVLGRCGELELMLGRLRRQHLLPEDEYVVCERRLASVHGELSEQQQKWARRTPISR